MLSIVIAAALATPAAPANDVLGLWKTETRGGVVQISRCGASVCGRLVTSDGLRANPNLKDTHNSDAKLRARPLKGLLVLSGFKADGATWTDGRIYNADDGKTYAGHMTTTGPRSMKVEGCALAGLVCRAQNWTKLN